MKKLHLSPYLEQEQRWPSQGRHILAQADEETVVVYQAYNSAIGHHAAEHQTFGGDFRYGRMSWVKPNFLWMMYRSGWGTKSNQDVTLAIWLERDFFESLLAQAVPTSFDPELYDTHDAWRDALSNTSVHVQWDPDHGPTGTKLQRRALQLGLRGDMLTQYGRHACVAIQDISSIVSTQRPFATPSHYTSLMTPTEDRYEPAHQETSTALKLSQHS